MSEVIGISPGKFDSTCVVGVLASEKTAQKMCIRYCQHELQRRMKAEGMGGGVCPGKAHPVLPRLSPALLLLLFSSSATSDSL